ncbi:ABC transporter ATP-binding protein/permease [Fervidibacillus halotolerans]|uniref:ABC transporter ATP-binding protein/permease n=2 Tax=Fervidibacillus halotolerans TaxID=2980027 RepID=A0A9E8M272_9BACI|nr:ABC transporter ATP-binding protein [Fervidibacillus halotolerans]WAA13881.1 ABC transporter ATP-binding protein/permease [Fervidibacillus halotolerans]
MIVAWLFMSIELAVELISPLMMAKVIDEGVLNHNIDRIVFWGGILLVASFLSFASGIANSFFAAYAAQHFGFDIRQATYRKIQRLPFQQLNEYPTSSFITRLTNDVTQVQSILFISLRIAFRAPLLIIFGTLMALFIHLKLGIIFSIAIPIIVLFLFWAMKKAVRFFKGMQKRLDHVNKVIRENLSGIRLIKAFQHRSFEKKRYDQVNMKLKDSTIQALAFVEMTGPILLFFMNVGIMIVLWMGKGEITIGNAQPGDLVAIVNYGTRITHALGMLSWIIMAFSRAKASSERIQEVLMMDEEIDGHFQNPFSIKNGSVQFRNVSFRYPNNQGYALSNISFTVLPGQLIAIFGATGSGKTTLFHLIPRLYEPVEGDIYIDGENIRHIPTASLRKQIGYVPQESHLFTGTVKENIAWGKEDATMEEIVQAAKDAQIHETIMQFPHQYDTVIGQKGVNLSGGQKQRLAIARALIRKPKILLLDDSTSALDLQTENRLLERISKLNCTTLLITNKISRAKNADCIFLLDGGKLIAKGIHEQLLNSIPLYREIVDSQKEREVILNEYSTH